MNFIVKTRFLKTSKGYQMIQSYHNGLQKVTDITAEDFAKGIEAQAAKKQMVKSAASGVALAGGVAAGEAALAGGAAAAEAVGAAVQVVEVAAAIPAILTVAAVGGVIAAGVWGYKKLAS